MKEGRRDYIAEILDKKSRLLKKSVRIQEFGKRFGPLLQAYDHTAKHISTRAKFRAEFLRCFPISAAACIEGYFRLAIKDLIDSGKPYEDNTRGFKNISIDITDALAIHQKAITVGDFVAHLLSMNGLEDINRNMTTVTGEDFLQGLKEIHMQIEKDGTPRLFHTLAPNAYRDIKELYRLRHIFCHEFAAKEIPKLKLIESFLRSVLLFVVASDIFVRKLMKTH